LARALAISAIDTCCLLRGHPCGVTVLTVAKEGSPIRQHLLRTMTLWGHRLTPGARVGIFPTDPVACIDAGREWRPRITLTGAAKAARPGKKFVCGIVLQRLCHCQSGGVLLSGMI
jgi:hypothetical protein